MTDYGYFNDVENKLDRFTITITLFEKWYTILSV